MGSGSRIQAAALIALIAFPFVALSAAELIDNLIPLIAHQIYYLPVAWLGEPLFSYDGDLGTWPRPLGRVFAASVYVAIFAGGISLAGRRRRHVRP